MSMTQSFDLVAFTEREFEEYRAYVETWKQKRDDSADVSWALEDIISKATYVYDRIARVATELRRRSTCEPAAEAYVRNQYLLREWLIVSSLLEKLTLGVEATHGRVEGAEALRKDIVQAREDVYSPTPVTIDSEGRVYEMTGEPAIVPGLDPEQVVRGMNDAKAGRTRSLKDIIAGRTRT